MKCGKIYLLIFIIMDIGVAVLQPEVKKDENIDSVSLKTVDKEINLRDINTKLEEMRLLIEDNRLLSWNREQSTIDAMKKELKNEIISLKTELSNNMDNSLREIKSDIVKVSEKLNSEINKVNLKMDNITNEVNKVTNNVKLSLIGQNTVTANELKAKVKLQSDKIVGELKELKELNYNKTNPKCDNLKEFEDVKNLMIGLAVPATNCAELRLRGDINSGVKAISGLYYFCDQETDGGGWTVFQTRDYRVHPREDFFNNWASYSNGFGNLSGEFWFGLNHIHSMTKGKNMELRVNIEDDTGVKRFAVFKSFWIENESEKFRLNIGSYSGNAGNSLRFSNQLPFSTYDNDNDESTKNCAHLHNGAWWYNSCGRSNLNGFQLVGAYTDDPPFYEHGIWWDSFRGPQNSMQKSKMMFRPE